MQDKRDLQLPHAILLDLDDTILDIEGSAQECWRLVCAEASESLGIPGNTIYTTITKSRTWFWSDPERNRAGRLDLRAASRAVVERALASLRVGDVPTAHRIADAFRDRRDAFTAPFPGAVEALARLHERGVRLALMTNGPSGDQRAKIERFGLARYFDALLIEGELGFGKPDPRVYRHALDALDANPRSTWSAGDNLEWDVAGPQRLGVHGIWVNSRGEGLPPDSPVRPDRIVQALRDLV